MVMFFDFKGFSYILEGMELEDLVVEIDYCFCVFDEIMEKYGLEKIKMVGDVYLAVGGMWDMDEDEVVCVILVVMEIQEFMVGLKIQWEVEGCICFEVCIGIYIGLVVVGIVGIKKFVYDIWGDIVNFVVWMEISGEVGKVNVFEVIYVFIQDFFSFI